MRTFQPWLEVPPDNERMIMDVIMTEQYVSYVGFAAGNPHNLTDVDPVEGNICDLLAWMEQRFRTGHYDCLTWGVGVDFARVHFYNEAGVLMRTMTIDIDAEDLAEFDHLIGPFMANHKGHYDPDLEAAAV